MSSATASGSGGVAVMAAHPVASSPSFPAQHQSDQGQHQTEDVDDDGYCNDNDQDDYDDYAEDSDAADALTDGAQQQQQPHPLQTHPQLATTGSGNGLQMVTALSSASDQWRRELARERLVRSGWLEKRGDKQRSRWKRRWFVLRGGQLAFYKDESEYSPMGLISTADIHSVTAIAMSTKHEHVMAVVTRKKTLYLDAAARVELEAWLLAFDDVVRSLPPSAPSVLSLTDLAAMQANTNANVQQPIQSEGSSPPQPSLTNAPLASSPTSVQGFVDASQVPLPSSPAHHPRSYSTGEQQYRRLSGPPLFVATRQNSDPTGLALSASASPSTPATAGVIDGDPHDTSDSPNHDVPSTSPSRQPHSPLPHPLLASASNLPPSVTSDLTRQFTHRAGWLWRYERANLGALLSVSRPLAGKHWKRRWCVLRGDRLLVYKDEREYTPLRVIALQNVLDVLSAPMGKGLEKRIGTHPPSAGTGDDHHHPDAPPVASDVSVVMGHESTTCFHVVAAGKTYQFASDSRSDMCHWVRDLRRLVAPFQMGVSAAPPMVPMPALSAHAGHLAPSHGSGAAGAAGGGGAHGKGRPVSAPADVLVAGAAAAGIPISSDEASDDG